MGGWTGIYGQSVAQAARIAQAVAQRGGAPSAERRGTPWKSAFVPGPTEAAAIRKRWKDALKAAKDVWDQEFYPAYWAVYYGGGATPDNDPAGQKWRDAADSVAESVRGDFDLRDLNLDLDVVGVHPGMHPATNSWGMQGSSRGHWETEQDVEQAEKLIQRMFDGIERLRNLGSPGFEQGTQNYFDLPHIDPEPDRKKDTPETPHGGARASRAGGGNSSSRGGGATASTGGSTSSGDHSSGRGGADADQGRDRDVTPRKSGSSGGGASAGGSQQPAPQAPAASSTSPVPASPAKAAPPKAAPSHHKEPPPKDPQPSDSGGGIAMPDPEGGSDDRAPTRRFSGGPKYFQRHELPPRATRRALARPFFAGGGSTAPEVDRGGVNPRFFVEKPNPEGGPGTPKSRDAFPNPEDSSGGVGPRA